MKLLLADTDQSSVEEMFSCQTCGCVFTCLTVYQTHRKEHAGAEGVNLSTCQHCTYVTDNAFHFNWHVMSHASQKAHQCEICRQGAEGTSDEENSSSQTGAEGDGTEEDCERISASTVPLFGKRSIATQCSEDLIYPSTPPPPYQQHLTTKTIKNRGNIYNNLDAINSRDLTEDQEVDDEEEEDEEDDDATQNEAEEEEEDDDNETEEELEELDHGQNFAEGGELANGDVAFYQQEPDADQQQQQQHQQFDQQQYFEQPLNGDFQEAQQDDEDDGTIEDEEVQELLEHADEYEQTYEDDQEQYQEEEEDGQVYEDGPIEQEDGESTSELARKVTAGDVYDFNSEEEEDDLADVSHQPGQSNGIELKPMQPMETQQQPQQQPQQQLPELLPTMVTTNGAHLQPTFVHQPYHPHHHQQGLPALQPAPPHHHQQQPGHQTGLTANATTTFQLQPHPLTTHGQHGHHGQPTFITIPSGAGFAPVTGQQVGGNYFQLEAAGSGGQTIRVVSIPAQFNPQQHQPQPHSHQGHPQVAQQMAQQQAQQQVQQVQQFQQLQNATPQLQTVEQAQQQQQQQTSATTPTPAPTARRSRSKKATAAQQQQALQSSEGVNGSLNATSNGHVVTTTGLNPPFVPTKGKGKGNRKPRINFISVINGVTVGADGIRRKFHCSHCGNGKSFKTKSHLQRHMLTHTGEKPYQCNECGSKFNQSSSLRNHMIAIHTKKFPHVCTVCGKGFLMPAVLQKHIQQTNHWPEGGAAGLSGGGSTGSPSTHAHSEDANSNGDELAKEEAMYVYS